MLIEALVKRYEAQIAEAEATLEIYLDHSVGIGEHPQHLDEMDKLFPPAEEEQDGESSNQNKLTQKHIDKTIEFVHTIEDIIRIGKNVMVCRNFDNLKHESNWAMSENPSTIAWCCNVLRLLVRKAAPFCNTSSPNKTKVKQHTTKYTNT